MLMSCWSALARAQTTGRKIYVANFASSTLGVFPINADGNVASLFTETQLNYPRGIAYWSATLYVVNGGNDSITAYPANSTGRPDPIITIKGSKTQLNNPSAIALDSLGRST
jgi:DNA-binding beta-propeller fold protein YncE